MGPEPPSYEGYEHQNIIWEFIGNPDCGPCSRKSGIYVDYPIRPHENCRCDIVMRFDDCNKVSEEIYSRPIGTFEVETATCTTYKTNGEIQKCKYRIDVYIEIEELVVEKWECEFTGTFYSTYYNYYNEWSSWYESEV
ncbi:MAG: hypothetical protein ACFFCI_22655 [Promethearchaeota archaeon]